MHGLDISARSVAHQNLRGRQVLLRVDLNMPIDDGFLRDEMRLISSLETIEHLRLEGARVVLLSHRGRPGGQVDPELSLRPIAARLSELLATEVVFAEDCVGATAHRAVEEAPTDAVVLLENTRFHPGEAANDPDFAAQLAELGEVYVNDAFATIHRQHASTVGVAGLLPSFAGLLLEREVEALSRLLEQPEEPFVVAVGGGRSNEKLDALSRLVTKGGVDAILIGGSMAFTFFAGQGISVGASPVEGQAERDAAKTLLNEAFDAGCELMLPLDLVLARTVSAGVKTRAASVQEIPDEWIGVDIGPRTRLVYADRIKRARTVFWNGPMGVFEIPDFAKGTHAIAAAVAACPGLSVVGGAHSARAITQFGLSRRVEHVSTGGRASLGFLEGKPFPGLEALVS